MNFRVFGRQYLLKTNRYHGNSLNAMESKGKEEMYVAITY